MSSEAQNEYDFFSAQRGKFYRKDATFEQPIYLDPQVRDYLVSRAPGPRASKSHQLVNDLLRRDIELNQSGV